MSNAVVKAIAGDKANETITSGTLTTTRGIGVLLSAMLGLGAYFERADAAWLNTLDDGFKVAFIIAAGLIWAIVAAADNLARGLATAAKTPVQLPSGLSASRIVHVNGGPNLTDPGWSVVAVLAPTTATGTADFLIVKNGTTAWVAANKLIFP